MVDLQEFLKLQRELDEEICLKNDISPTALDTAIALSVEASELIDACDYKWWSKDYHTLDDVKEEAIDVLHFLLSFFNILGMDDKEIFDLYKNKRRINFERQNKEV